MKEKLISAGFGFLGFCGVWFFFFFFIVIATVFSRSYWNMSSYTTPIQSTEL